MPDLPACRDALSQAATTLRALVEWLDSKHRFPDTFETPTVEELRADIQAARAQLDLAEQALTGTESK